MKEEKRMPQDAHLQQVEHFEQVMTTVFTCRSIVKYNLVLNEEQKNMLLLDIDTALDTLRAYLMKNKSTAEKISSLPPDYMSSRPSISTEYDDIDEAQKHQILLALYKLYHSYLNTSHSTNIEAFINRFNNIMSTINAVQYNYGTNHGYTNTTSFTEPLHTIKVFIADLYYMFMDIIRMLSEVLQLHHFQLDTEELASIQNQRKSSEERPDGLDLAPLLRIYATQQRLEEREGFIPMRIGKVTAVLDFLRQRLNMNNDPCDEISIQLEDATKLLGDLAGLLTEYEQAVEQLLLPRQ